MKGVTEKKRKYLEAILFASEGIVSRNKLQRSLTMNERQIDALVDNLKQHYEQSDSSLKVVRTKEHVSLSVKDDYLPFIKNFIEGEFSSAVLKTLALVYLVLAVVFSMLTAARPADVKWFKRTGYPSTVLFCWTIFPAMEGVFVPSFVSPISPP